MERSKYLYAFLFSFVILIGGTAFSVASAQEATNIVKVGMGSSLPGCENAHQCYLPYHVIVNVGEEISWHNDDTVAHTVTSGGQDSGPTGEFDSSLFMGGSSFSVVFEEKGVYPYFCMVHPWMTGVVTVSDDPILSSIVLPSAESVFDAKEENELIKELREENLTLKKENKSLKQQINQLESQVAQLEDIIINTLKEIYKWMPNTSYGG